VFTTVRRVNPVVHAFLLFSFFSKKKKKKKKQKKKRGQSRQTYRRQYPFEPMNESAWAAAGAEKQNPPRRTSPPPGI
jgi:hypothetical protein